MTLNTNFCYISLHLIHARWKQWKNPRNNQNYGYGTIHENVPKLRVLRKLTKEISKYTKENMQAERFGPSFSHIGLINLISWPGCPIFTDASLDTHINMTYVRHLSSLTSEICQ